MASMVTVWPLRSSWARIFDDGEGFEALGKTAGVINFIRISGHPGSVHILDMVYILNLRKHHYLLRHTWLDRHALWLTP